MRNLKRVLSLALAVVMVIGMMVMGTSAVDFSDAADIDYPEAVEVMAALGILEGYNGEFNPDQILTREQAAKIICYMLVGPTNAEMLNGTADAFADVEADRWSAPFISYCSSLGIIAGYAGNFDPEGELTGVAFAKLLLVALGYDAEIEGYVNNTNWATNIGSDAIDAGINIPGVSLDAAVTREQAAQMALNAIKTPMVEYETKGSSISVNGAEIVFGASKASYVTTTLAKEQRISIQQLTNSTDYTVEFGEKYFPALSLVATYDAMARPAHEWLIKNESIGLYSETADYEGYIAGLNSDVEKVVDSFSKRFDDSKAEIFVNGICTVAAPKATAEEVAASALAAETKDARGNYVEVYMNEDDATLVDRIVVTHNTVDAGIGTVTTAVSGGATYVVIPGSDIPTIKTDMIVGWEDIDSSVIMYHQDNAGVYHVIAPEFFAGTMTATTDETGKASVENPTYFHIAGDVYEISGQTAKMEADVLVGLKGDTAGVYWLDGAGYVIWGVGTVAVEEPLDLMLVLKNNDYHAGNVFKGDTLESQVVFVNETGATKIINIGTINENDVDDATYYPIALDYDGTPDGSIVFSTHINENSDDTILYSYEIDKDGVYHLTDVIDDYTKVTNAIGLVKGIPSAFKASYTDIVITDSKTVYLVRDAKKMNADGMNVDAYKDTYSVYTGFANVPSLNIAANGAEIYGDGVAQYVVINEYSLPAPVDVPADDIIYVLNSEITAHYNAKREVDYFTVSALVDGVKTTLKIANGADVETTGGVATVQAAANPLKSYTLYQVTKYDSKGNVDTMAEATTSASGAGTYFWVNMYGSQAAKNDKFVLDTTATALPNATSFAYAEDCVVYTVSGANDVVVVGTIADLATDPDDKISMVVAGKTYGTAANNTAVEIYVHKETAPAAPVAPAPVVTVTNADKIINDWTTGGFGTLTVNYIADETTAVEAVKAALKDHTIVGNITQSAAENFSAKVVKDGVEMDLAITTDAWYKVTVDGTLVAYMNVGNSAAVDTAKGTNDKGTGFIHDSTADGTYVYGAYGSVTTVQKDHNVEITKGYVSVADATVTGSITDSTTISVLDANADYAKVNSTVTVALKVTKNTSATKGVTLTMTTCTGGTADATAQTVGVDDIKAADAELTFTVTTAETDVTVITFTKADAT